MTTDNPVTIDSSIYEHTFWGILNPDGAFWCPLVFDNEQAAIEHVRQFFAASPLSCVGSFSYVPVRAQLTAIGKRARQDPQS